MKQVAQYISQIEIKGLWGKKDITWNLRPDVNILSGINGIGKSTILNDVINQLNGHIETSPKVLPHSVEVHFYPEEANRVRYDVVRSFDRPLIHSGLTEKIGNLDVKTELDWQLYLLQRKYLDYQVNIGNRIIELLTSGNADDQLNASQLSVPKATFQNMIDELFSETGKQIIRKNNEISFIQDGDILSPYQLSSGEKQMLVILLTVLIQDNQPYTLFMDEPEISLHIEWQQRLISLIRKLNPHVQIILTTHSPALIMNGWMDAVTEVSDITSLK